VHGSPTVSVILPTFNERAALTALHPRLVAALRPYEAEIVVVDDRSPDGTGSFVQSLAPAGLYRLVERPSRAGLASAVVEGIRTARGEVIVVMDADGSHPPESLPDLIEPIRSGLAEFVLASRRVPGGRAPGLSRLRRLVSTGASFLARPFTPVRDPMSGFFAIHRSIVDRVPLRPAGFKIALEILVKCSPRRVLERPFSFEPRVAGTSKLGSRQVLNYLRHLARLTAWRMRAGPRAALVALPLSSTTVLFPLRSRAADRVQDDGEAGEHEAGRAGLADPQVLAHQVEGDPGYARGDGAGEDSGAEISEGAFAAGTPGLQGIVAYEAAQ